MGKVTRAFVLASSERYASVLLNLGATAVLARLLAPAEFGIVVIGISAAGLAGALVELGAASYIVQVDELDRPALRSVFTINAACTLTLAALLYLSADRLAALYGLPQLVPFLRVFSLGFAMGVAWAPASALLARNLAFGRKSAVSVAVSVVNGATTIALAFAGFSYMSFAWGYVASSVAAGLLYPLVLEDRAMFGVGFHQWRRILLFGTFGSFARLVGAIGENLAYLVIGRFVPPAGVGMLYRAGMLVTFPDRVVLGAAAAVALPAFSQAARRDRSRVGEAYLDTVELLSGVHWPAVVTIGLLAHPLVSLFLGRQWLDTATLVQIMCCAALFNAPMSLNYPVQVAMGAIRATPVLALFQVAVAVSAVAIAAPHGATAIAWSTWISTPINVMASVWLVRRIAPFPLRALPCALWRSGVVALATGAGPVGIMLAHQSAELGLGTAAIALLAAAAGWVTALVLTRHPIVARLRKVLKARAGA